MPRIFSRLFNWGSHATTAWGMLPGAWAAYVTSAAWGVVMVVGAYVQGFPLVWTMMAIPVAVAAILTATIRGSEWWERSTPVGSSSLSELCWVETTTRTRPAGRRI